MHGLTAVGDILADYTPLPSSGRSRYEFMTNIGGTATDCAAAASRLGLTTVLVGRTGEDFMGEYAMNILQDYGVDTSQISRDSGRFTAHNFISLDADGERRFTFGTRSSAFQQLGLEHIDLDAVFDCRMLYLTGMDLVDGPVLSTTNVLVREARLRRSRTLTPLSDVSMAPSSARPSQGWCDMALKFFTEKGRWSLRGGYLLRRIIVCVVGEIVTSLGIAVLLIGHAGVYPYTSFLQGVAHLSGLSFGVIVPVVSILLLIVVVPFDKIIFGLGAVLNFTMVGVLVDYFQTIYEDHFTFTYTIPGMLVVPAGRYGPVQPGRIDVHHLRPGAGALRRHRLGDRSAISEDQLSYLPRGPGRPRHHARTRPHGIRSLAGDRGHRDDHHGLLPRSDHRLLHTRISIRLVGTAAEAPELESRVQAA